MSQLPCTINTNGTTGIKNTQKLPKNNACSDYTLCASIHVSPQLGNLKCRPNIREMQSKTRPTNLAKAAGMLYRRRRPLGPLLSGGILAMAFSSGCKM